MADSVSHDDYSVGSGLRVPGSGKILEISVARLRSEWPSRSL